MEIYVEPLHAPEDRFLCPNIELQNELVRFIWCSEHWISLTEEE